MHLCTIKKKTKLQFVRFFCGDIICAQGPVQSSTSLNLYSCSLLLHHTGNALIWIYCSKKYNITIDNYLTQVHISYPRQSSHHYQSGYSRSHNPCIHTLSTSGTGRQMLSPLDQTRQETGYWHFVNCSFFLFSSFKLQYLLLMLHSKVLTK